MSRVLQGTQEVPEQRRTRRHHMEARLQVRAPHPTDNLSAPWSAPMNPPGSSGPEQEARKHHGQMVTATFSLGAPQPPNPAPT